MAEAGSAAGGTVEDDGWWEGAYLELGVDSAIVVVFFAAVAFHSCAPTAAGLRCL